MIQVPIIPCFAWRATAPDVTTSKTAAWQDTNQGCSGWVDVSCSILDVQLARPRRAEVITVQLRHALGHDRTLGYGEVERGRCPETIILIWCVNNVGLKIPRQFLESAGYFDISPPDENGIPLIRVLLPNLPTIGDKALPLAYWRLYRILTTLTLYSPAKCVLPKCLLAFHEDQRGGRLGTYRCCIHKSWSTELSEAINSMYKCHREASVC